MQVIRNIRWIDHNPGRKLTPSPLEVHQMKSHAEFLKASYLPNGRSASFASLLLAYWQRLGRWHALYRQRRQLAALSDHMLKDLGLSRADIETEANRPFWDDPLRRG